MVTSLRMSDYDLDLYAWSLRQGSLLRRLAAGERVNDAELDWPNIGVEIETLGRSERGALRNCVATIIECLLKLQASPRDGATCRVAGDNSEMPAASRGFANGQSEPA